MRNSLALSVSGLALVASIFAGQTDHALAQSSDDVAKSLATVQASNAELAKENAALREHIKLTEENEQLRDHLRQNTVRRQRPVLRQEASAVLTDQAPMARPSRMPMGATPSPVAASYSWTGLYIGGNAGDIWGRNNVTFTPIDPASANLFTAGGQPAPASFNSLAALGGFQIGYNWQFDRNWLLGVETDVDWSGVRSSASSGATAGGVPFTATEAEQLKWFGTIRARLGFMPIEHLLIYATGGFAYGRVDHSGSYVNDNSTTTVTVSGTTATGTITVVCATSSPCYAGASSSTASGWAAGTGLEYAATYNWTIKAEYLHVSLGSTSVTETALLSGGGTPALSANNNLKFDVVRVGANYKF
jgi:outer membrane immunogenic protein